MAKANIYRFYAILKINLLYVLSIVIIGYSLNMNHNILLLGKCIWYNGIENKI